MTTTYSVPEQWLKELLRLSEVLKKKLDNYDHDYKTQAYTLIGYINSVQVILKNYKDK